MSSEIVAISRQGARTAIDVDLLRSETREQVRTETIDWIKRLRSVPFDGVTMRDRFTYRGDSLWWFTEIYLQKTRRLERAVETILVLDMARDRLDPARFEFTSADRVVRTAALAFGQAGLSAVELRGGPVAETYATRWSAHLVGWGARLSRLRPGPRVRPMGRTDVAAFIHNAFWRQGAGPQTAGQESYIGPVLEALARAVGPAHLACVGVGPRRNFRARRWWDPLVGAPLAGPLVTPVEQLAPRAALEGSMRLWRDRDDLARQVTAGEGIRAAAGFRGCDLWEVLRPELEDAARLQWTWSARAMDEAGAALDALAPRVVLTYAEAGGWGRALGLEARRRQIPSFGLQHGFIYRHWLNYLHEPDEMEPSGSTLGFPRPDRTLLFDDYAARHVRERGHFPPGSLVVTGSARLDLLAGDVRRLRPDRLTIRRDLGVQGEGRLAVLAAKFSEIALELPELCRAVAALPALRLVIKAHPAETVDVYASHTAGIPNISVAPPEADLATLLAAADLLITMNSTVAIDALVMGVPALVIGLPNNLSPFVEAGVMAGAGRETIGPALAHVLYDRGAQARLLEKGSAFAEAHQMRADGQAAARAAREILTVMAQTTSQYPVSARETP